MQVKPRVELQYIEVVRLKDLTPVETEQVDKNKSC